MNERMTIGEWLRALTSRLRRRPRDKSDIAVNTRLFYADIAWFGLIAGVTANFLAVYVTRLGASPFLLSALTSGPALMTMVAQMPAVRIVERYGNPKRLTLIAQLPHRLGYLLIALIPFFLPQSWQAYAIVAFVLLQGAPASVVGVAFSTMFSELVPRERMAAVVGGRNAFLGVTSTLTVILCGFILTTLPFPLGYQVLFVLAFLGGLGSMWCIYHLRDIPRNPPAATATATATAPGATSLRKDQNFRRFSISAGVLHLGLFMSAPLLPLYWVDTLHLSDAWISAFATILSLTSIAGAIGLRSVVHRWDVRTILAATTLLAAFHPILTSLIAHPVLLALVAGFAGIWGGAINVVLFSAMTEVCPPHLRPRYIGVYTLLMNFAVFVAPLLGAALANVVGIHTALIVAGLTRAAAGLLFFWLPFVAWDQSR